MTIAEIQRLAQQQGSLTFEYNRSAALLIMNDLKTGEVGAWVCTRQDALQHAYAWVQVREARRKERRRRLWHFV
jgi:hypothetical protein